MVLRCKGAPHKVDGKRLFPISRVWFTFINHTLSSSSNISDVFALRALLIFCIMKGIQINVGLLIASNMEKLAQANPGLLGYPFLITRLLIKQEVPLRGNSNETP